MVLNEQELREFSGILNPKGPADTEIESLDKVRNEYRLKALRESNPRMEQLHKNVSDTAYLKSDCIRISEKDEQPEQSQSIVEGVVSSSESISDLSRLERFKNWAKENIVSISAIAISVADIITTIAIGACRALNQGAQATGKFAKAVYNLGKKLGGLIAPLLSVVSNIITWAAKGMSWFASNLWVLT